MDRYLLTSVELVRDALYRTGVLSRYEPQHVTFVELRKEKLARGPLGGQFNSCCPLSSTATALSGMALILCCKGLRGVKW